MPNEDDNARIFSGLLLDREAVKLKTTIGKILHHGEFELKETAINIVGGDSQDIRGAEGSPAIIIEKDGDRISKIIVKCPCGRHSELLCEYEEGK